MVDARCSARGRPRISTAEERRRHLLETAEAVFLSAGYHATTMDDVARGAGMSKRTVYQVFASKAEMFEALLTDRFCPLTVTPVEAVEQDGRPMAERLAELLLSLARFCLDPRHIAMIRLMIAEAPLSRDMADALERLGIGRGNGILEQWLTVQVAQGLLKAEPVDEAANALFFTAIGEAHLHALLRVGEPPAPSLIERRIAFAVRLFLRDALVGAPAQNP